MSAAAGPAAPSERASAALRIARPSTRAPATAARTTAEVPRSSARRRTVRLEARPTGKRPWIDALVAWRRAALGARRSPELAAGELPPGIDAGSGDSGVAVAGIGK